MNSIGNLHLLGSSHISKQSIAEIKDFIENNNPDIVAVELDKNRYVQIMSEEKQKFSFYSAFRVGFKGFIFAMIGHFAQKKLGKVVGIKPGSEMKKAIKLAKKHKKMLALIDQDINITLFRFSKYFTWKEKWTFVKDIFTAMFGKKREIPFDLDKVPSQKVIKMLIKEVKIKYPNVYRVLVEERNEFMAKKLLHLLKIYPDKKIFAIVGAGHEEGMMKLIKKKYNPLSGSDYSFSFEYDPSKQNT